MTDTGTKKKASIKTMLPEDKEKKKSPAKKPAPKKPKTEGKTNICMYRQ
jgi:hypothetical protein